MVEVATDRRALLLAWDAAAVGGSEDLVDLKTEAVDGEDVSGRDGLKNDGLATVTVPKGAHGSFKATVSGPNGTDEGTIEY